jgi:hypothetical protein
VPGSRVVSLISRPDYDGFGFSIRPSERGPHVVSGVEPDSPGQVAGLRADDLILRVNDVRVVGQRFSRTAAIIKNESEKGRLRLEVIEAAACPEHIRHAELAEATGPASAQSTVRKAAAKSSGAAPDASNIAHLKQITAEALAVANAGSNATLPSNYRGVSVDTGSDRFRQQQRPQSMTDIDRIQQNSSTVRSNNSFYSTNTGLTDAVRLQTARSVGNLSSTQQPYKPKFKRCVIQLIPEFQGRLLFFLVSKRNHLFYSTIMNHYNRISKY